MQSLCLLFFNNLDWVISKFFSLVLAYERKYLQQPFWLLKDMKQPWPGIPNVQKPRYCHLLFSLFVWTKHTINQNRKLILWVLRNNDQWPLSLRSCNSVMAPNSIQLMVAGSLQTVGFMLIMLTTPRWSDYSTVQYSTVQYSTVLCSRHPGGQIAGIAKKLITAGGLDDPRIFAFK